MAILLWQPGVLIQPGDLRRPTSAGEVTQIGLANPDLEDGNTGWSSTGFGSFAIDTTAPVFSGSYSMKVGIAANPNAVTDTVTNSARIPVEPGQLVTARCYALSPGGWGKQEDAPWVRLNIQWFNAQNQPISPTQSPMLWGYQAHNVWQPLVITGVAPPGAATFTVTLNVAYGDGGFALDQFVLDFASQAEPNRLIFRAVQAAAGFTGASEPDWPTEVGQTVVDNEVTWEAISPDNVTWQANRILVSGSSEPAWPLAVNASVPDNTISWVLDPRRVSDPRVPQTPLVAIAASKVFAGDGDIVAFSATTNPLDWTKPEDAGYLPFGLQTYGANPITALGLYRGNLVVSNSVGTQIWQVDPDPAGMALLDAIPIGCTFPKTMQPVGNDLAFLTEVGIRNMGTVGAAVNLQAGYFGKPIDELVIEAVKRARNAGREPIATYWPAQGQYWVIFGNEAFVLTVNDGSDGRSWSRYVFPSEIDYAAVLGEELYLRSGDLVWRVDESADADDVHEENGEEIGEPFSMVLQWPHLDFGSLGQEKQLVAFDLVGSGEVSVSIGYDQRDSDFDPDGGAWTPLYEIGEADTLPGQPIPLPVAGPSFALRLEFTGGETREFIAANLYIADTRRG